MMNRFILVLVLFALISCRKEKIAKYTKYDLLEINAFKSIKNSFELNKIVKGINFITLQNTPNSIFSEINKILIKNGKIYILDLTGPNYLYVFNINGIFLNRIGKIGKGPGEYLMLCDFDVNNKGEVFLYSRQFKKIYLYDSVGNFICERQMCFRADGFKILNENKYLFSLLNNSDCKITNNRKFAITDSDLNIIELIGNYGKNFKDNRSWSSLFKESKSFVLYNKPADDSIYCFDYNGEIKRIYYFNFGKMSMPQTFRNDAFLKYNKNTNSSYKYLINTPIQVGNFLMGNLEISDKTYRYFYFYDIKRKIYYENELNEKTFSVKNINFPLAVVNDSIVISYIDSNLSIYVKDSLPEQVKEHINNNGVVLILYTIHLKHE